MSTKMGSWFEKVWQYLIVKGERGYSRPFDVNNVMF